MAHLFSTKQKAILLRKKGYSLKEVAERLLISKSTASLWLSAIDLSDEAIEKLRQKQVLGQYKTVLLKARIRKYNREIELRKAEKVIDSITFSVESWKVFCVLLWWCEGNKDDKVVRFTSSDSSLVQNFLRSFRSGFDLNETKFRALVHIHSYHDDETQRRYWSEITKIPLEQFYSSYKKANTGIRTKEGYQGCIAISYYDAKIAKELYALYNAFTHRGIR